MNYKRYVLVRGIQSIITILLGLSIVFFLFRALPGDPVDILARDARMSPEGIEAIKIAFGLDKPLHIQYYKFMLNTLRFEFGTSFVFKAPVESVLVRRLSNTLSLIGPGTIISMIFGLSIGIIAGWYRRKWPDKLGSTVALMLYSMPSFWIGMILIYLFAVTFQIFPAGGISSLALLGGDPIEVFMANLKHLALPLITYSLIFAGQYALLLRSSMVNVLSEDYILTAKAKGLRDLQVLRSHAMKNAALPATTIITMNLGAMVLGSISVETVFNWPGIGLLIYSSIGRRDYPMLQGAMIVFIFIMILANFIADLLYGFLDPRIRY